METRENKRDYSCSHNNVSVSQLSANTVSAELGDSVDAPGVQDDDGQGQNCPNTVSISVHSDIEHTAGQDNINCCPSSDLHSNTADPSVTVVTGCHVDDTSGAAHGTDQLAPCTSDQSSSEGSHSVPVALTQEQGKRQEQQHRSDDMHDSTSNRTVLPADQAPQQNQQMPNQTHQHNQAKNQNSQNQPQNQHSQNQPQNQHGQNQPQNQHGQNQPQNKPSQPQTQRHQHQNGSVPRISEERGENEETDTIQLRQDGQTRRLHNTYSDILTSSDLRRRRSTTVMEAKQHAYARLQHELNNAQTELRLKDEECGKLGKVRDQMEIELEDLTASLFEEANNMVQEANIKRMHSEKLLTEANNKIEVLQAEVTALKALVLTSTPSSPNKHLHPQIDKLPPPAPPTSTAAHTSSNQPTKKPEKRPFWKGHRRSTSHHEFTKEARQQAEAWQTNDQNRITEIDPVCFEEFRSWRRNPELNRAGPFLSRIILEDITPCLSFNNRQLSVQVQQCVQNNTLMIEPIKGAESTLPRNCSLSETCKLCNYKIHLGDDGLWLAISLHCRNRIAAVCDFFAYIRYIIQGLVKSEEKDSYNEVVKLRRQMALARLGYT